MDATLSHVRTILVVFVLLLMPLTAAGQDPWEYRTSAGEWAFATGNLERAETEFRGALELAQAMPAGDPRLETSLENLARLYEHEMRLDEALPLYQLLVAAREERLGSSNAALLDPLLAVARVGVSLGDTPTAEASLDRYLEIADRTGLSDPAQHWRVLSMYARMKTLSQEHGHALELQRRAVQEMSDDPAATAAERAAELESLAQMELLHGSADDAERMIVEAAELRSDDGGSSPAEALAAAAATAFGAGEVAVAERLAERSVAAATAPPPMAALEVLANASWLRVGSNGAPTDLLGAGGDRDQLDLATDRLTAVVEHPLARNRGANPELSASYARLATVAALRGDAHEAARWKRQQLELSDQLGPTVGGGSPANSTLRSELVALLVAADRTEEALAENTLLIETLESGLRPDDARLVPALQRQQELLTALGRKRDAKAIKKRLRRLGG
jgi:tetratricopeptide (TPR) repeat protein